MKRRTTHILLALLVAVLPLAAQENERLEAFQRNFLRASLKTKIQVLQDAADETEADMGPLYLQALDFAIENTAFFRDDPVARELAILAVRLVGISGYREALEPLWDLFLLDSSTSVRIEVLNAVAGLTPPDPVIVQRVNRWMMNQIDSFQDEQIVDQAVLSEAAVTLGTLGDERSFPILFSMTTAGFSDSIAEKATEALYEIEGDFADLIERVIRDNPINEKLEALRIANANATLDSSSKAVIAAKALAEALAISPRDADEREYQRQIRYEAVRILGEYAWSDATDDVVSHFDLVLSEYYQSGGRLSHVLEAIDSLGAMGNHEAAVRLSLYLDILNSDKENGKNVDEEIVLAVMRNLGSLGDRYAFDFLLYARYLDYSEQIKKTASEAINKL